jgi:hypothetical protein
MRFHTKFAWVQFAGAILWVGLSYLWFHKPTAGQGIRSAYFIGGICWLFSALSCIANYFFTWWEVSDSGLTQRRLLRVRTIPWNEITRIGPWQPGKKPNLQWLAVDYVRPAPMSDRGELLIHPADRNALVQALRTHAPQADFEFIRLEI